MLNSIRIGVVVTTYNSPAWLEKVFWGYAKQTDSNFELIIADDGSTDDTKQLIDRYQAELPFPVQHVWQEDKGFRKTTILNKAIAETSAAYLIFTDGDCIPEANFVATHRERAKHGRFLSGGYYKLTQQVSKDITRKDIDSGQAFSFAWLNKLGQPRNFKRIKLTQNRTLRHGIDWMTTAKCSWNGMNSSCFRRDIESVNGFDERMHYGGLDREFGERLINKGLKGKQVRYSAICLHLEHERDYSQAESMRANQAIRDEVKKTRSTWTEYGLSRERPANTILARNHAEGNRRVVIAPEYQQYASELLATIEIFDSFGDVLQQGRNTIRRGVVDGIDLTIKSFKRPILIQAFIYGVFRPSKAKRSYEYAIKLMDKHIGTATPIAYIEEYRGCLLTRSYFLSRYIEHDFTIRDVLDNKISDKKQVFKGFVDFTAKLHNSEVLHLDHSPGNTLIKKHDHGYDFSIIDINRMAFRSLNLQERLNNFVRLAASEQDFNTLATLYAAAEHHDAEYCREYIKEMSAKREHKRELKRKFKRLINR